jgi:hypothetical protein
MKSSDCRLYRYSDSATCCFIVYCRCNAEIRATFKYNTPLPRIIDTGIRHYDLLCLLNAEQIVIHPYCNPLAPQALLHIEAEVVEPNLAILPDGARQLAEA